MCFKPNLSVESRAENILNLNLIICNAMGLLESHDGFDLERCQMLKNIACQMLN